MRELAVAMRETAAMTMVTVMLMLMLMLMLMMVMVMVETCSGQTTLMRSQHC